MKLGYYIFFKILLSSLIILSVCITSYGQIKTSVKLSSEHKQQLERLKELKKFNKKTLKELKFQKKHLFKNLDSLSGYLRHDPALSRYIDEYYGIRNLSKISLEGLDTLKDFRLDSLDYQNLPEESQKQLSDYDGRSKAYFDQAKEYKLQMRDVQRKQDSALLISRHLARKELDKVEKRLQQQFLNKEAQKALAGKGLMGKDMLKETGLSAGLTEAMDGKGLPSLSGDQIKKAGTDYFEKHGGKLSKAKGNLTKLKKKYSYVPNSADLSSAKKVNSLAGETLKKRLVLGGNLQIHPGRAVKIDFSPLLGYKFNKKFIVGMGGTYRGILGRDESVLPDNRQKVYGGRFFSEYKVVKTFYAHGELEILNNAALNFTSPTDTPVRQWSKGLMFGAGRTYRFAPKVNGKVTIMYNFLHNDKSPHTQPWVVRFGFTLK